MQVRVLPSAVLLVSQFSSCPPMHLPHILVEVRLTKWRLLCLLDHRFGLCTNIGRYPFNYSQSLSLKSGKIEKVREQSLSTFIGRRHLDIQFVMVPETFTQKVWMWAVVVSGLIGLGQAKIECAPWISMLTLENCWPDGIMRISVH